MDELKLFFDRSVGTSIPEAMRLLGHAHVYHHHLNPKACGVQPRIGHKGLFAPDEDDDVVLRFCGQNNWFVVSQDYSYHFEDIIRDSIKQQRVGVFYIWGANARKWDTFSVLVRAYDRLIDLAQSTERPFIFKIAANARFIPVSIDPTPRKKRVSA